VTLRDTAPLVPDDRGLPLIFALIGAGVTLVWGLTCANVGNLFLARSLRRDREIVVRLALGASRGRIVRQLLAEGLVLASIAGVAALGLAAGVPLVLEKIDGASDGTTAMFEPDSVVAVVATLATMLTCLIVALAPALQATRITPAHAGRGATRFGRMREVVVAVQIAVATVLVLSATLVGRGLSQAVDSRADFALETTSAATFSVSTDDRRERERIRIALRDAVAAAGDGYALVDLAPLARHAGISTSVRRLGEPFEFRTQLFSLDRAALTVLDVPIIEGRPHDDRPKSTEAIVNQRLANTLWPGESAVGKAVHLDFDSRTYTIVGVTRDTHLVGLGEVESLIHTAPFGVSTGVVLAASTPALADRMRALAKAVDPALTVDVRPLSDSVSDTLRNAVVGAVFAGFLGVVALLLAVIGVFGVFSYLVEERRREIGIRLALGASRQQVRAALARACRRPVVLGVGAGVGMSLLAGMLLRSFLYGLSPIDPLSYVIVAIILLTSAFVATAVPVRRALRVDPAVTLRAE
jgi:predicted permease